MAPWEGVQLAPNHYPGRDRVLALAALLKMVYGEEVKIWVPNPFGVTHKDDVVKYTDLPTVQQISSYQTFKRFYDRTVTRTFKR